MLTGDGPVPVPAARTERTADGRPRASRYRLSLSPMQLHRSHVGAHKARVVCVSSNTTHITLSHTRGDGRSLRDGFNVISARAGVGGCPPEPFRSGVALHTVAASKRPPYLLNSTSCRCPPFLAGGLCRSFQTGLAATTTCTSHRWGRSKERRPHGVTSPREGGFP